MIAISFYGLNNVFGIGQSNIFSDVQLPYFLGSVNSDCVSDGNFSSVSRDLNPNSLFDCHDNDAPPQIPVSLITDMLRAVSTCMHTQLPIRVDNERYF